MLVTPSDESAGVVSENYGVPVSNGMELFCEASVLRPNRCEARMQRYL